MRRRGSPLDGFGPNRTQLVRCGAHERRRRRLLTLQSSSAGNLRLTAFDALALVDPPTLPCVGVVHVVPLAVVPDLSSGGVRVVRCPCSWLVGRLCVRPTRHGPEPGLRTRPSRVRALVALTAYMYMYMYMYMLHVTHV